MARMRRVYSDGLAPSIQSDSAILFAETDEPRSRFVSGLASASDGALRVKIGEGDTGYELLVGEQQFSARDTEGLGKALAQLARGRIYIDMTGLTHSAWAPLVKAALSFGLRCSVLYVEPDSYRFSAVGSEGEIFDLSERIEGVRPIPGFDAIGASDDETYFVPLLGFEGVRFAHLLANIDVPAYQVRPVVGAPGYHIEFPEYSFLGNADALLADSHWTRVQYARADCAFSLYRTLTRMRDSSVGDGTMMIAPIGTKPHALGAVLYTLCSGTKAELVYDHPRRSPGRTTGVGKLIEFPLDGFTMATL